MFGNFGPMCGFMTLGKIAYSQCKYKANRWMAKKVLLLVLISSFFQTSFAQNHRSHWVDSVYSRLSTEARVGQLFLLPVSLTNETDIDDLTDQVKAFHPGAILITNGGPIRHAKMVNRLQKISATPLLVAASAEWGIAQTLDSIIALPKPLVATAWSDDNLRKQWTTAMAAQFKALGIHMNLAPNADNEVFANNYLLYFGADEKTIATQTTAFVHNLQHEGILCVAKHLPRKPVTNAQDTSLVLNVNNIDTTGFAPFRALIQQGVRGILTSNLHFSVRSEKGVLPAAISPLFISEILKKGLDYQGLVITDVRGFQKTSGKIKNGDAELLALEAGNDVLLAPIHPAAAVKKITRRIKRDKKFAAQIERSVKKVLEAKYDAGLIRKPVIDTDNLVRKLNSPELRKLVQDFSAEAITVVKNEDDILPFKNLEDQPMQLIAVGAPRDNAMLRYMKKYTAVEGFNLFSIQDTTQVNINPNATVTVALYAYAAQLSEQLVPWINRMAKAQPVVVVVFGNPDQVRQFPQASAIVASYTDQDGMEELVPQVLFGARTSPGQLPIACGEFLPATGIRTDMVDRLSFALPEAAGMDSESLQKIRSIMQEAVDIGGAPGCQVIVARHGKVIFDRTLGWLSYDNQVPVTDETIYDLASLTKVSATLQATMFLYDKGMIDLNKKVSVYLPELQNTNKKDITLIDMLTHQSGLVPFVPMWTQTVKDSAFMTEYYHTERTSEYPLQVAPGLFAKNLLRDSVWSWVVKSKMQEKPARTPYPYRYSDLGLMIMKQLAERLLNQPIDEFLRQNVYEPLGATTTGFNPLDHYPESRIAPTEIDKIYRKTLVVGTVHDERAAMMGGVSGHAGLFSTGTDLIKLGQMLLQEGSYGGIQYYKPETVRLFANKQFEDSRRGIGWDKPLLSDWSSPTSLKASPLTFGHTGFTGTCMWIDPEFDLVYVFLSNRTYPDRNGKLLNANIRSRIQDAIYQSIFDYCQKSTRFGAMSNTVGK